MGRKHNSYGYGLLTDIDSIVVEKTLDILKKKFGDEKNINILEVGIYKGNTSVGIKNRLKKIGLEKYTYWGIDSAMKDSPFKECNFIYGKSEESYIEVPDELHWVLIDGCHCSNHVILDFFNYGYKVVEGGIIVFHDSSPLGQEKYDYQGHGVKKHSDFGTSIISAFDKIDIFHNKNWSMIENGYDSTKNWGGTIAFEKRGTNNLKISHEIISNTTTVDNHTPLKFWDGKFKKTIKKYHKISFCITCMDRLYNLKETLPINIKDNEDYPNLEFVILDYNSKDGLGQWVKDNLMEQIESGRVSYYRTTEPAVFSMAHSRNIAYRVASGDIVNNLDADNYTVDYKNQQTPEECWASYLNRMANECDEKVIFAKGKRGMHGRIGFYKDEFINILGGYDESLIGYGHDDHDLVKRAWELGFTMYWWGGKYYDRIRTSTEEKNKNMAIHWKITEDENKIKSDKNIAAGIYKANQGISWGKVKLIKNFTEEMDI